MTPVKSYNTIAFSKNELQKIFAITNSSLFYIFHTIISDCWHLGKWHFSQFPVSLSKLSEIPFSKELKKSFEENRIIRFDKRAGGNIYEYHINQSKPIIDEIDKVLAKHYGFTEEELDFIINYDIKYRMGDELNTDEE